MSGCRVDGCEGIHAAHGYCHRHYQRIRRHGDPHLVLPPHNAHKTHCPRGHAYDEGNTYTSSSGKRNCRACRREQTRAYRAEWRALGYRR